MPYYRSVGAVPHKRHTQFRQPDGSLYAEELMGVEGFSSDSALLYHRHRPTAITAAVAAEDAPAPLAPNHPLKPRHLKTH
jgi:homogentisate 1,2-dioxygenase